MAGHSKWSQIKRQKGVTDAARGRLFTKLGKEIYVAAKTGGTDPNSNPRLRDAIAKARNNNMPNDNVQRCIKKAEGASGGASFENITYEGYGTNGVAVIVEALTDNKNRTAGDVRHLFEKYNGSLGVSGSVSFMFERLGIIEVPAEITTEDTLLETLIASNISDIKSHSSYFEILCEPTSFTSVCADLERANIKTARAAIEYIPTNYVALPDDKASQTFEKMIDLMEELDDVQNVFHNAE
jgi:YebC/PmpR family DNA-binding regulatory protein